MKKTFYGLRFNPEQYMAFKQIAESSNYTLTAAFEQFMEICIAEGKLVFPIKHDTATTELQARVLVDWLGKGKLYLRDENGEEINIQALLLKALPKIQDPALKTEIEAALKNSVTKQC